MPRTALYCAILSVAALMPLQAHAQGRAQMQSQPQAQTPAQVQAQAPAQAQGSFDLASAWRASLVHDPSYQAAISEREAGQTNRAMGRAGLLPQVSASLGRTRIDGTLDSPTATGRVVTEDLDYTTKTN